MPTVRDLRANLSRRLGVRLRKLGFEGSAACATLQLQPGLRGLVVHIVRVHHELVTVTASVGFRHDGVEAIAERLLGERFGKHEPTALAILDEVLPGFERPAICVGVADAAAAVDGLTERYREELLPWLRACDGLPALRHHLEQPPFARDAAIARVSAALAATDREAAQRELRTLDTSLDDPELHAPFVRHMRRFVARARVALDASPASADAIEP